MKEDLVKMKNQNHRSISLRLIMHLSHIKAAAYAFISLSLSNRFIRFDHFTIIEKKSSKHQNSDVGPLKVLVPHSSRFLTVLSDF